MHLFHVQLTNFRLYRHLEVALDMGTTLLWGANASGKSSFLEAIFMLATTHSPRAGADREVIHWDATETFGIPPFARVVGRLQRADGPLTLEMVVQRQAAGSEEPSGRCQKRFLVNRQPVRARDAAGRLQVVLFEPEDLNLVTGSPARRRRYLDVTLMQADARYWQSLQRYHQVVLQRNRLLRRWREEGAPPGSREEVAFWNREMVEHGSYLIAARARFIAALGPLVERLHRQLSGTAEQLTVAYRPQVPCPPGADEAGIAFAYRQALASTWPREVQLGQSLLGPHRDDLSFSLDGVDLATYGSRGQQRTSTIALKLAQVEWLRRESGEAPIVLLDDVLSELDPARRSSLQGWLLEGGCQVILTATDLAAFLPITLEQSTVYRVDAGRWTPLERKSKADDLGKPG